MSTTTETLQVPAEQKAWVVEGRGEPSKVLAYKENAPVSSKLQKGEVLVKVQAAALNPVGHKVMKIAPNFFVKRPYVAENDFSGVVVDANGTDLVNGQDVFGFVPIEIQRKTRQGTLAQYIRAPADFLAPRPPNVSVVEAAGFTLAGLTAYNALFAIAKLESGQSVFVNGGSTAVGIFAIQLAKAVGCTVGASASTQRKEFLESLGVDRFVDYTQGPVYAQLERDPPTPKYHVFLEAVGNTDVELYTHSPAYLAPGGIFMSVGPQPESGQMGQMVRYVFETCLRPSFLGGTPRTWKVILKQPTPDQMKPFAQFIAEGKVKPAVDSIYAFDDVHKAYERIMTKHACGKVVVKIDPEAY